MKKEWVHLLQQYSLLSCELCGRCVSACMRVSCGSLSHVFNYFTWKHGSADNSTHDHVLNSLNNFNCGYMSQSRYRSVK